VRKGETEVRTVEACVRKDENGVGKFENEACRAYPRTGSDAFSHSFRRGSHGYRRPSHVFRRRLHVF
jgi:hypothetical protein